VAAAHLLHGWLDAWLALCITLRERSCTELTSCIQHAFHNIHALSLSAELNVPGGMHSVYADTKYHTHVSNFC
jgi:hypothetical protein